MQQELIAGTTLNFATSMPDYPASAGWTLKYYLRRRDAAGSIDLTAAAEGDEYRVQVSAATTAAWVPATYAWESRVELGAEKYPVDNGQIVVLPDIASSSGTFDSRSQAERAYEDARSAFADFNISGGVKKRYRIGDREVEYSDKAQIVQAIEFWALELKRERRARAIAAGLPDPRNTYVRFDRA